MSIEDNEILDSYDSLDGGDIEDDEEYFEDDEKYSNEDEEDLEDDEEDLEDSDNLDDSQPYAETIMPDGFYEDILEFEFSQSFYQSYLLGIIIVLLFIMGMKR